MNHILLFFLFFLGFNTMYQLFRISKADTYAHPRTINHTRWCREHCHLVGIDHMY